LPAAFRSRFRYFGLVNAALGVLRACRPDIRRKYFHVPGTANESESAIVMPME